MTNLIKCDWCGRIVEMADSHYSHIELRNSSQNVIAEGHTCPVCTNEVTNRLGLVENKRKATHGAEFYTNIGENKPMKTLKQQLIDRIEEGAMPIRVDQILEVVEEWLTQKRHSEEDNEVGTGMWNGVIDHLLEELKQ